MRTTWFVPAAAAAALLATWHLRRRLRRRATIIPLHVHALRPPGIAIEGLLQPEVVLTVGDAAPADTEVLLLFMEGGRVNGDLKMDESLPKQLFAPMVCVLLKPAPQDQLLDYPHYECPVYRTAARRGVLATTGHSSNFVMFLRVPSEQTSDHWIARGCALLCSLSD